jgi:hypothetical protein
VIAAAKKQKRFLNTLRGNSVEAIRKNEELFDYSNVGEKDLPMAKRWFKAPKPPSANNYPELSSAYHQYRVWNVPESKGKYKGHLIHDKATGESAYSPPTEEAGPLWHKKESEGEESEGEEVGAAMAAVRLE